MLVSNKTAFNSSIYSAIVINTSASDDPENQGRIQIYIPAVHYEYASTYTEYMVDTNKRANKDFSVYPWATTLISGLNLGDTVYGGYIDNDSSKYIILGKDDISSNGGTLGSFNVANLNTSALMDLIMPIIMSNEVGCSIDAWINDSIADSYYTSITLHDGGEYDRTAKKWIKQGCWAIGLIQWNGGRAFKTLYECVKGCSENWESEFPLLDNLKLALKASLTFNNPDKNSTLFGDGYNPDSSGKTYAAIKKILGYKTSKSIQKTLAIQQTSGTVDMLKEKGVNNPAILIYLADLMNQYGTGLPETITTAVEACKKTDLNIMQQLDYLINNKIKSFATYYDYKSRRDKTYKYIESLYESGKFTANILTDITGNTYTNASVVCGKGQYSMPFQGKYSVTATYGRYTDRNKPEYAGQELGGYHGDMKAKWHNGIDFGMGRGTPLYACTDGTVTYGTQTEGSTHRNSDGYAGAGHYAYITAGDGNYIWYMHLKSFNGSSGRKVKKGDLIGYSGNTGCSSGPHLHFEIRVGKNSSSNSTNPFPYIGYEGNDRYYGKYIGS